ncbi:hypothetical protein HUO09_17560 [Vibrio sp. Y2-5]|uniref:hypothetical protein n=1 Tax=Vibrio sp. Y2-5 TaxID=2743977 RepID=UPI001660FF7C|nr:hypothetical protein [Vibrio sp. Y2-5]MBD0788165.1 hypothetical protein [Vibrio sp. Y2-5]
MCYCIEGLTVDQLTEQQLRLVALKLVAFFEFTFFSEREVTEMEGLVFVLEYIVVDLGLIDLDKLVDSPTLMSDFVKRLNEVALKENVNGWDKVKAHLPYFDHGVKS